MKYAKVKTIFMAIAVTMSAILPAILTEAETNDANLKKVANSIAAIVNSKTFAGAGLSVEVRDTETGTLIYSKKPDKQLIPASNMKIITAAASMALLGPGYKFRTEVYRDGPIRGGVINGNLYLKGYGDPSLVDEYLWTLARDLAYRGIIEIKGKIIGDDSYFDQNLHGKGWGKIGPEAYFAPMSALSLNFNTFVVSANPGKKAGAPPKLFYMPPTRHLRLVNRATTTIAGGKLKLKVINSDAGPNSFDVVGSIPLKSETVEIRRTVGDPTLYTIGSFEAYLISWGIAVNGIVSKGKVPKEAKLVHSIESKPLSRIIQDAGKISNNFVSEQILKTICANLGPEDQKSPAGAECGIKLVQDYLKELGIEPENYTMADGSGLSRLNRLSARQLTTVLVAMKNNRQLWPEFAASLSIAGVDGTLEDRFIKSSLRGKVRAKTGHLTGVNTLSGYVPTRSGKLLAFSILANNFSSYHSSVERAQRRIVEAAAEY